MRTLKSAWLTTLMLVLLLPWLAGGQGVTPPRGGGESAWGAITGTLADQTDLQGELDAKQDEITFGTGAETALGVNVGSAGAFVVNGGALGTPSSGTLTNTTGFPIANLAGAGAGVLTWAATPSSANLRSALSDENGTGAALFDSFTAGTGQFANTGLSILDTNASHSVNFSFGSDLTADRTITLITGNSNRSLQLAGSSIVISQNYDTSGSPQFAGVNIGHASDTTITRLSAGVIGVEGDPVVTDGRIQTNGFHFLVADSEAFGDLPTPILGMMAVIEDSNTTTWGATAAGGGSSTVLLWYNGANWTVIGS